MSATSSMTTAGPGSEVLHERVEGVDEGGLHLPRQMGVDLGRAGAAVPEVGLDEPEVDAGFQQMGRVGMSPMPGPE